MRKTFIAYVLDSKTGEQAHILVNSVELDRNDDTKNDDTRNVKNYIDYILNRCETVADVIAFVERHRCITINAMIYPSVKVLAHKRNDVYKIGSLEALAELHKDMLVLVDIHKTHYEICR